MHKNERVNWFTAVNRCLSYNASLAVFNDNILQYFPSSVLTETEQAWIGLVKSHWTWPGLGQICCNCCNVVIITVLISVLMRYIIKLYNCKAVFLAYFYYFILVYFKKPCSLSCTLQSFCAYLRQTWVDLHQIRTKIILSPFYTMSCSQIHFTSEDAKFFSIFVCLSACDVTCL